MLDLLEKIGEHWRAVLLAVLVHAGLAAGLLFSLDFLQPASRGNQGESIVEASVMSS